jgi:general nucleoside transport system ATP-binding protein
MVGRNVLLKVTKTPANPAEPRLQLVDVWAKSDRNLPALRGLNLTVRSGEIVGLAGVDGNGQSELEQVIAGLRPVSQGQVLINGRDTTHGPVQAIHAAGLAHIPSDRYNMGLLSDFSVAENLLLQRIGQPPFTRHGFLNWRVIRQEAARLIAAYDVRVPTSEHKAGVLSGGNAQKMILARELNRQPQVLLAAQPTRGVDVSAIEYIHARLIEQRDAGVAILLISTELEEILTLSDRIAVLYEGQIVGLVETAEADINQLGLMMAGTRQEQVA